MPRVFVRVTAGDADDVVAVLEDGGFRASPASPLVARGAGIPEIVELVIRNVDAATGFAFIAALKLLLDSRRVRRLAVRIGDRLIEIEGADRGAVREALDAVLSAVAPGGQAAAHGTEVTIAESADKEEKSTEPNGANGARGVPPADN